VRGGIDKRPLVMLAVNFHELLPDLAQYLHGHRLIVDESARAPVGELYAPQNKFAAAVEIVCLEHLEGRMARLHLEHGDNLPLFGALPHKRGIAARPERQRECVEHDRLARAGLARQRGEARREIHVELVDQDDVTNGEMDEHGGGESVLERASLSQVTGEFATASRKRRRPGAGHHAAPRGFLGRGA